MLFGSSGDEYKDAERDLAKQRAMLKKDLGLDDRFSPADMLGLKDEDLVAKEASASRMNGTARAPSNQEPETSAADAVAESGGGLSARERNRLKRLAKRKAKEGGETRPPKRPRGDGLPDTPNASGRPEVFSLKEMATENDQEDALYEAQFGNGYWDFQSTCEVLKEGLLETRWEWRHGAAIGLRQILMRHAQSAGRYSSGLAGDEENALWLEDLCCRLVCVLAMDRFGDFVGDAVVAPVREAAAMTLGASAQAMPQQGVKTVMERIFFLLASKRSSQWEVRHAAFLGVRYILAVKEDMAEEFLRERLERITDALRDQDDDVRAVAAEALLPIVPKIVTLMPHFVPTLVTTLWEALLDLDDISASTSSVMRLLSEITAHPAHPTCNRLWLQPEALMDVSDDEESHHGQQELDVVPKTSTTAVLVELVPRVWPFLRHSSKAVRRSVVNLLHTVTEGLSPDEFRLWVRPLSTELFSRLFRNILLEVEKDILESTQELWGKAVRALGSGSSYCDVLVRNAGQSLPVWLQAASQETRGEAALIDQSQRKSHVSAAARRRKAAAARRAAKLKKSRGSGGAIPQSAIDGDSAPTVEGPFDGALMQKSVAAALGHLALVWPSDDLTLENSLIQSFQSQYANARKIACDICDQWAKLSNREDFCFSTRICASLEGEVSGSAGCAFAEVGMCIGSFFTDAIAFLDVLPATVSGIVPDKIGVQDVCGEGKKAVVARDYPAAALVGRSIKPQIINLITGDTWEYIHRSLATSGMQKRRIESVESLRMRMLSSIGYMTVREDGCKVSLAASASSALVSARGYVLPQKVGPLIKALMAGVRTSKNPHLQAHGADAVARLALRLAERGSKKPLALMLKNLMKYLVAEQKISDRKIQASLSSSEDLRLDDPALAKRGALSTFKAICKTFEGNLFIQLPWLWDRVGGPLTRSENAIPNGDVNEAMKLLRSIVGHLSQHLHPTILELMSQLIRVCAAPHDAYAQEAPLCLADVVAAIPSSGMQRIVIELIPLLGGAYADKEGDRHTRRGAAVAIRAVVQRLGTILIPYAAFMIVPMMKRMIDEDLVVRDAAAGVFGTLVRLMPLEGGAPDDPHMSEAMTLERREARTFLGQLLGTEPRLHYELPTSIGDGITLRKYQQECLDWLAFLNKYGLHGALCDDMGLGKTLMTLCMITGDFLTVSKTGLKLPSLVVCPSTIVAHWAQEAERFFQHILGKVVQYAGLPKARARLRSKFDFQQAPLIVTSYDILSNDLKYFSDLRWNYVVLDEGHVIKNPKTRVAKAVRVLSADHRLVLTGTPIQNSVVELWAMFDFLMPGFLGSEKTFKETYAKPIMASRDGKCTEADQERGMVATESLHRQVLPFVLRRLKDDVLSELPPKIMQDYYCNMTPLQFRLYEDFASEMGNGSNASTIEGRSAEQKQPRKRESHIFQALSYLRRLCSHPKLVLTPAHPQYGPAHEMLRKQGRTIDDIQSSAKLVGLMNILNECAIGQSAEEVKDSGGHRVLIFAQLKQMLDLVEKDLFKTHMPNVTYLRLDGSVEASKRQNIVTRFNADPTIDCLLLTTHVGGLGLNLTGADTVIFLEHDWNPTKDLQAMDRAHRMGQKRTVNVYRLITRGTLEEKIMGIQRFKTHIANTVVNRENSNLQSMNTEQLLDLFKVDDSDTVTTNESSSDMLAGTGKGMKAALAGLGELWEEKQYEEEYNMADFLAGMKSSSKET